MPNNLEFVTMFVVFTCAALNLPGFELDDRVGVTTEVFSLAAVPDGWTAQIQLAQGAERADLIVVHSDLTHHKHQTSDSHRRQNQRV